MRDYSELDDVILRYLEHRDVHPTNCTDIYSMAHRLGTGEPWRLIDRRMQALRKAGHIKYDPAAADRTHGWVVLPRPGVQA